MEIFAIGHSTHPLEEFVALLKAHGIETLADVRTVPKSRHNPQFSQESLALELPRAGIRYVHLKSLGGLRHARPDSQNIGWENLSFRGYADYMQTEAFAAALDELIALGAQSRTAIMCAEGNPARCHRSLVADALVARGVAALHISSRKSVHPHKLTPFARVEGTRVTYPGSQPNLL
ncbi:MAG: DUF488 domain-containing protein [Verrucomicrobia bacterium]|nr:DUF488 domain-containing protein [Verrucomicrobiota bacterium]